MQTLGGRSAGLGLSRKSFARMAFRLKRPGGQRHRWPGTGVLAVIAPPSRCWNERR